MIIQFFSDIIKYILKYNLHNLKVIGRCSMFTNKEYVLTVWREGSFTKAANKLYISQPSLSATIKRIEEKLSYPIFDRSTNPLTLTEAGKEYIRYALEIKEKEKEFEKYIYDYSHLLTGTVRIGGSSLFSSFVIPEIILSFNKVHPKVKFEVYEDSTKNLIEKLSGGQLDIIIDNAVIESSNIDSLVYRAETLLLAVPKGYEINEKIKEFALTAEEVEKGKFEEKIIGLDVFKDYPFILLKPENDTGRRARLLFEKYGMIPKITFQLDQQVTAYNVSATGMGISFVSDTLIKNKKNEEDLCYYRIGDEEAKRNIYFSKKNGHYLSNACLKFIEFNTK